MVYHPTPLQRCWVRYGKVTTTRYSDFCDTHVLIIIELCLNYNRSLCVFVRQKLSPFVNIWQGEGVDAY